MRWRLRQSTRAAAESPGILLAVLFGVLSLLIPGLVQILPASASGTLRLSGIFAAAALAIAVAVPAAGMIALRSIPPAAYAQIMVGGRPTEEVLHVISSHVEQACSQFLAVIAPVEQLAGCLRALDHEIRKNPEGRWEEQAARYKSLVCASTIDSDGEILVRSEVETVIRRLRDLRSRQHGLLQRITEMKHLAAQELGIPVRRLCDHILQYSPAIHRDRTLKYLNNWRELRDSVHELSNASEILRFGAVAAQNVGIWTDAKNRVRLQQSLQRNIELHPFLYELASIHSTSGSLQSYSRFLAFVALKGRLSLDRTGFDGDRSDPNYRALEERFLFALRKQRAHPGVDLNTTLIRACEEIRHGLVAGLSEDFDRNRLQAQLSVLRNLARRARERDAPTLLFDPGIEREASRVEEARWRLQSLELLPSYLTRHIVQARNDLMSQFRQVLSAWFEAVQGTSYLVSHGYSKTVREVIRRGLLDVAATSSAGGWGGNLREQRSAIPPVYLVIANEQDEFDTRRMEYELTEELSHRKFGTIGSGDLAALLGMIDQGDRILVLLGAECFDLNRRVVHPRGMVRILQQLLCDPLVTSGRVAVLIVVVAEHYKLHPRTLTRTELFDDHLDRIDLYRPERTDLIITNRAIFPEGWKSLIRERLSGIGQ